MDSSIAIVGMSCRFAGCSSTTDYWNAIMSRKCLLTVPGADAEIPFGQRSTFPDRRYPKRIGQLGGIYAFDQSKQHVPRELNAGENQDLYFATQLAFDALTDANVNFPVAVPHRGSVRFGYAPPFNASTVNWLQHTSFLDQTMDIIRRFMPRSPETALEEVRKRLAASLPAPDPASFLLGTGYRFASWIARECSFAGAATIMDAGMLTGAATVMDAVEDLRNGHADLALAGALTPPINRAYLEGVSGEVEFSTRTELQPFSAEADGTIPGEGGAFFVLKRREDALRDRNHIYALIRSVAIGHNPDGDASAILAEATEKAGVPVRTIGLVEADGTGIPAMDAREIAAIQKLWGEHKPGGPLVGVGSVKGNIGHTLRASMAAGLVKAALALRSRVLPPQVSTDTPLAALSNLSSSAYLLAEARPWITGDSANPRRAAVMGSNFDPRDPVGIASRGGRSAVIILEEEPEVRE